MIFVTLGTQDKSFKRLLKAIDKEIKAGNIKEDVIVQAGHTEYTSDNMEIFDLISPEKFDEIMAKADLVITHGGAGSILTALKNDKKVIAAPRLKKYREHTNDHQKEIIEEFANEGYILSLYDFSKLAKLIEKAKTFKPKKFKSNTNNMIKLINDYIDEDNHTSWLNKSIFAFKYLLYCLIYLVLAFCIEKVLGPYIGNYSSYFNYSFILFFLIGYFIQKKFIYKTKNSIGKEIGLFILYLITNPFIYWLFKFEEKIYLYPIIFVYTLLINKFGIFRSTGKLNEEVSEEGNN